MKDETKVKITWAIKKELKGLDPKLKDIILNELFSIVDKRLKYLKGYQQTILDITNSVDLERKREDFKSLYLQRSE